MVDKSHELTGGESPEPFPPARPSETRESESSERYVIAERISRINESGKKEIRCKECENFFEPNAEQLENWTTICNNCFRKTDLPSWKRENTKTGKIEVQCCVCWSFFPPMTPEDPETTCPSCIAKIRAFAARKSADTFDKRFQKKIEDFRNGTDTETVRISRKTREKIEIILLENHLLQSKDQLIDNILNSWCDSFDKARNPPPIYKTKLGREKQ